jgi:hypothetical protein
MCRKLQSNNELADDLPFVCLACESNPKVRIILLLAIEWMIITLKNNIRF